MTLKRVRRYALLVGIALWTVVVVDYATPGPLDRFGKIKGTDFVQFYASGTLVRSGRAADLYDPGAYQSAIRAAVPEARETIYLPVQSPQLLLLVAPLAALPYTAALGIWVFVIVGLYAAACVVLWSRCASLRGYRREVILCAVAFPGLYATVIHGQASALALVAIAFALVALERGRGFRAGLALGCLVFKPHWVAAAGLVFLVAREWKVVAGITVSALAQIGATVLATGPRLFLGYLTILRAIGQVGDVLEPRPGYALRSFFSVFAPDPQVAWLCYAVAALAVLAGAARVWRSAASFDVRASALVLALVLVSPHVFEYDLVVLAPVFLFLANAMAAGAAPAVARAGWPWVVAALYVAPVLTAVPPALRLQCSATAMAAILWKLWLGNERELRGPADAARQSEERAAHGPGARGDVHVVIPRRVEL